MKNTLAATKTLCAERLGLRFDGHAEGRLRAALDRQLAASGGLAPAEYLDRITHDQTAFAALTSLLTIKETYFFREPEQLRLLTEVLLPRLRARLRPGLQPRPDTDPQRQAQHSRAGVAPVRILSVGCATGEEPYSIAMALCEADPAGRAVVIDAVDVDPAAIAAAVAGRYRNYALRTLDAARRARWFEPLPDGGWQLAATIRRAVRFRVLNLLDADYPADLADIDVILYRNLSIYFDPPTRRVVLQRLRERLHPAGYLLVGVAETMANDLGLLTLCEEGGVWYFANDAAPAVGSAGRATAGRTTAGRVSTATGATAPVGAIARATVSPGTTAVTNPASRSRERTPANDTAVAEQQTVYQNALALAQAGRHQAALALLVSSDTGRPPSLPLLTLRAALLAAQGHATEALAMAERALAIDPWAVDALVVLGKLAQAAGEPAQASDWLRRAIYARPAHWPAHLALAECRRVSGDLIAARRGYQVVLHQLADAPRALAEAGPLPLAVPLADLRRLCKARLAALDEAPVDGA